MTEPGTRATFGLEGLTALVTGGNRGLGHDIARGLRSAGARVLTTSRNRSSGDVQDEHVGCFDLGDARDCEALVESVSSRSERLDILVNNSGIFDLRTLNDLEPDTWTRMQDVNVRSMALLSRGFRPLLAASARQMNARSRILNIGSVLGHYISAGQPLAYSISKAAVHHLTRVLARTLAADGINVNAIAPAAFPTDMTRGELAVRGASFVQAIPVGRLGTSADIAACAVFLTSPASEFITGHILALDGGLAAL